MVQKNKHYYGAKKYAKFDDGKVVGQTMFYQAGLKYLVPKGILYPVVGAFRALVEVDPGTGIYRWKKDPFMVWNDLGERIAGIVWDEKEENPEYIGKSKTSGAIFLRRFCSIPWYKGDPINMLLARAGC